MKSDGRADLWSFYIESTVRSSGTVLRLLYRFLIFAHFLTLNLAVSFKQVLL